jgi:hypothetical protein
MGAPASQQITQDSARKAIAVNATGGDVTLVTPCRAIYIGVSGSLTCRLVGDSGGGADVTFVGLIAGTVYPFRVAIFRSGAPASILALY